MALSGASMVRSLVRGGGFLRSLLPAPPPSEGAFLGVHSRRVGVQGKAVRAGGAKPAPQSPPAALIGTLGRRWSAVERRVGDLAAGRSASPPSPLVLDREATSLLRGCVGGSGRLSLLSGVHSGARGVLGVRVAAGARVWCWKGVCRGGGGGGRGLFTGPSEQQGYKNFKRDPRFTDPWSTRIGVYALVVFFPATIVVYYIFHLDRAPYTNRLRMIDMSKDREYAMGHAYYHQILSGQRVLPKNHAASQLVSRVGMNIAKASGEQLPWEFAVVDAPLVNAMCLPGGKVVVFRGLLEAFNYEEQAVAVVLAHECAHAIARHSAEQVGFINILLWGQMVLYSLFQVPMTGAVAHIAFQLPFSRKLELEADKIALTLLARTCKYAPSSAPDVFRQLEQVSARMPKSVHGRAFEDFMSTHPSSEARVRKLLEAIPAAETLRQEQCGGAGQFEQFTDKASSPWA